MKKAVLLGTALLLSLSSCSNPLIPKATGGEEIVYAPANVRTDIKPLEPTTEPPAVPLYGENERIICKIRHYKTDSPEKSVFVVQADGKVWYGTYTQNEGQIGTDNILRKSDGTEEQNFTLMDDLWMDAVLTEDAEDDFMLFGEITQLGTFDSKIMDELKKLAEKVSPDKPYTGTVNAGSSVTDYYYADVCAKNGEEWVRVPVMAEFGSKKLITSDSNAKTIISEVMVSEMFEKFLHS